MDKVLDITDNNIINEDISNVIKNNINLIDLDNDYEVLITWANGMLPSYLLYFFQWLNILSNYRINISVIIRNNTNRIDIIRDKKNIEIIWNNIENPIRTKKKFNYIIHAASDATPKKYLKDKINTINTNVKWLYNLLDLDMVNLKSFMFFSTAELYWNPSGNDIPIKENVIGMIDHINERSAYVETKKFCETLCMNYFFERELPVKIVRPFHTFWPWLDINDWRVFSDFIRSASKLENIVINSDWTATRAFCYLADALDMFVKVLFSNKSWEIYNIWNPNNEISIKNLANIVCKIVDNKITSTVLWEPNNLAPNRSCPDITKWINNLHFGPNYSVQESFERTLKSLSSVK
jgi:UDP-glucuronate decarboxylase